MSKLMALLLPLVAFAPYSAFSQDVAPDSLGVDSPKRAQPSPVKPADNNRETRHAGRPPAKKNPANPSIGPATTQSLAQDAITRGQNRRD